MPSMPSWTLYCLPSVSNSPIWMPATANCHVPHSPSGGCCPPPASASSPGHPSPASPAPASPSPGQAEISYLFFIQVAHLLLHLSPDHRGVEDEDAGGDNTGEEVSVDVDDVSPAWSAVNHCSLPPVPTAHLVMVSMAAQELLLGTL